MDIRIGTLRLQASGMDPDAARRFARLMAEHLDAALAAWPAGPGSRWPNATGTSPARLGRIHVAVQPRAWDTPDSLAVHMAAEVSRAVCGKVMT